MIEEKVSLLVQNQFPAFFREEGEKFIAFLRAYQEWLEEEDQADHVAKNLLNFQDVDDTTSKYLEFFKREVLSSLPNQTLVDRKLLIKNISQLYRTKGSEKSYNFLFRILYNEDIEFYYPGDDVLRASDGRWVEENSLRVGDPSSGDSGLLEGEEITGMISGATARVERISKTTETGIVVTELFLINISGTFEDGERVENEDGSVFFTVFNVVGPVASVVDIFDGGAFHQIDDEIEISSDSGSGARGSVEAVSDNSAVEFVVVNEGAGYTVNSTVTVTGGSGQEADFRVETIIDTEFISLNSDPIFPMRNVLLAESPTFTSNGDNTAPVNPDLASANIDTLLVDALTFTNTEVGSIGSIVMLNHGFGYTPGNLPEATVEFIPVSALDIPDPVHGGFKGRNAEFEANNVGGTITELSVIEPGLGYNINDTVSLINNERSGTDPGQATVDVTGVIQYDGKYIDTKGWLSWNNRLQDNFYYQNFSYEIVGDQFIKAYRAVVNAVLHPAGTKLFGRLRSEEIVSSNTRSLSVESVITTE